MSHAHTHPQIALPRGPRRPAARWFAACVVATATLGTAFAYAAPDTQKLEAAADKLDALSDAFEAVADFVEPSVVYISVKSRPGGGPQFSQGTPFGPQMDEQMEDMLRRFFGEQWPGFDDPRMQPRQPQPREDGRYRRFDPPRQVGAGSGWVWDDRGHIITNNHVVRNAEEIEVVFHDRSTATAHVVGVDPRTDVAVIKVDKSDLTPARRATRTARKGDIVFAFGSPFQYRFSISQGIVSGTDREVGILGPDGYENFIQTDAAINPGNSGGPLVNARGQVIGMNTAIASSSGVFAGIGFAVPVDVVEHVVSQLLEKGSVTRGYLGAYIGDDADLLRSFGVERGVLLQDVMPDGPAAGAGLEAGDVVTHIADQPVTSAAELRRRVAAMTPGESVTFTIVRDGEARTIDVKIGELPGEADALTPTEPASSKDRGDHADARRSLRVLGITEAVTFTPQLAREAGWSNPGGVLIQQVRPGSTAAVAGLRPGAVITEVMGEPVETIDALLQQIDKHDMAEGVRLRVRFDDHRASFVFLQVHPRDIEQYTSP